LWLGWLPIWLKVQRNGKSERGKCQHDGGYWSNSLAMYSGAGS